MSIMASNIRRNLLKYSFPRLTGTEHEKKALKLIQDAITDLGCEYEQQMFNFTSFFSRIYPKIGFLLGFIVIFTFFLKIKTPIVPISAIIILMIYIVLFAITRRPEKIPIGKKLDSSNVYVKIDSKNGSSDYNVFFICHLDSKGQRISIFHRIRAIRYWVFSLIVLMPIIFVKMFSSVVIEIALFFSGMVPFFINSICTALILINTTNNQSPGAIDDGTGIACVYELLSYYSAPQNRLEKINLWFVFTGAEECGTMGIRFFYEKIKEYDRKRSIIFNFDSIAQNIYIYPGRNRSSLITKVTEKFFNNDIGVKIKTNPKKLSFGSHSDGYFLKKKGFQGFGIGDMECYRFIHSKLDSVDKINPEILKNLCELITINLKDFNDNSIIYNTTDTSN
jgi:hypothetical protein